MDRTWRAKALLAVALAAWVLLGGCAVDAGGATASVGDVGASDGASWSDAYSADASDAVIIKNQCPALDDPKGDDDGDGLRNDLEDRNLSCQLDAGETDPTVADTDGDGLLDGWEDLNGDGVVNDGELDPRKADTDEDGTADGAEPLALVCGPPLLGQREGFVVPELGVSVALPPGLVLKTRPEGPTALVSGRVGEGGEVFGFVVVTEAASGDAQSEQRQLVERAQRESGLPLAWASQQAWVIPGDDVIEPRAAAAGTLRLKAEGSAALSAALSRDSLVSALVGAPIREGVEDTLRYCEALEVHVVSALHSGDRLVTGAVVVCADDAQAFEMKYFLEDWRAGSWVVPGARSPTGYHCEQQRVSLGQGDVDVLWVMDNSASMRDEEERARRVSSALLASLQASPLRWRLGVTTTEAYLLDDPAQAEALARDAQLDPCSALRGGDFLEPAQADVALRLEQRLFEDVACDLQHVSAAFAPGKSLCGADRESGLLSALTALTRTDPARALCQAKEAAQRRKDVKTVVFWVSDEDDGLMQDPLTGETLTKDDPQRHTFTRAVSAQLQQAGVLGCALVGDAGVEAGGQCGAWKGEYGTGAADGVAYREVVAGLGGVTGSVCGRGDSQALVSGCLGAAAGFGRKYTVARSPIAGSVAVAVDGQVLTRGEGWRWDAEAGAVVIGEGVALNERSRVAVALLRWR